MLTTKNALLNLRYGAGLAIKVAIVCWLLAGTNSYISPGAVLAYVLIVTSTGELLYGLFWYWKWFTQRGAIGWYFVAVGILLFLGWAWVAYWIGDKDMATAALVGAVNPPVIYGLWRLIKFTVVRTFGVLLIAISQIGAAWRGELRP
jgi:hypothetical protein